MQVLYNVSSDGLTEELSLVLESFESAVLAGISAIMVPAQVIVWHWSIVQLPELPRGEGQTFTGQASDVSPRSFEKAVPNAFESMNLLCGILLSVRSNVNASALYHNIFEDLDDSVASGNFTQTMRDAAKNLKCPLLVNTTASPITALGYRAPSLSNPTPFPSANMKKSVADPPGQLLPGLSHAAAAAVFGAIAVVAVGGVIFAVIVHRHTGRGSSEAAGDERQKNGLRGESEESGAGNPIADEDVLFEAIYDAVSEGNSTGQNARS